MCGCRKLLNHGLEFTAPCRKHAPQSDIAISIWDKKATVFLGAESIKLYDGRYITFAPLDYLFK